MPVLQRRSTIALVDELAHTNAPGSRNTKRYQDVEEILRAGINVITTLNIQHLESLHDIVERATGVRVKERLPDYVVTMADQIVNVDLSAEDLRERLQTGKVYPAERVQTALENFFTPEKLTRLRELAMEEIAFRLDRSRRDDEQRGGQPASGSDRVMVCLSSRSPHAAALLRKAARIADRLGAPWYAVYVQTPREAPEHVDAATQRQIGNSLDLARQLGGTSLAFKGCRSHQYHRRLRQGIWDYPRGLGSDTAAVVSSLVRPVCSRPPVTDHPRGRRHRSGQQPASTILILFL